jgi:phosphotransacetylase
MILYAEAESAGVIFGGKVPVAMSSAVDTVQDIYNSIMLGALLA